MENESQLQGISGGITSNGHSSGAAVRSLDVAMPGDFKGESTAGKGFLQF